MYGFWYLVIGFAIIFIAPLVKPIYDAIIYRIWYLKQKRKGKTMGGSGHWFEINDINMIVSVAGLFFTLLFIIIAICVPIKVRNEVIEFEIQKEYIEFVVESEDFFDNIAISQKLIELNSWLAKVKASKKTYGCFSNYYYVDLKKLEPITIKR